VLGLRFAAGGPVFFHASGMGLSCGWGHALAAQRGYDDVYASDDMKEILTKSFWQGVKKTFDTALEGRPPTDDASQAPAADDSKLKCLDEE
jgi:hypothetical protein